MASKEYKHGVRLVIGELNRLVRLRVLRMSEIELPEGDMRGYRYDVDTENWLVKLEAQYYSSSVIINDLYFLSYAAPCAGLTFFGLVQARSVSLKPEGIKTFGLSESRR